jgi:hypothetical protein
MQFTANFLAYSAVFRLFVPRLAGAVIILKFVAVFFSSSKRCQLMDEVEVVRREDQDEMRKKERTKSKSQDNRWK